MKPIFKYRKFDEHSFKELAYGFMSGCLPSALNDPFDCSIAFDFESLNKRLDSNNQFTVLFNKYLEREEFSILLQGGNKEKLMSLAPFKTMMISNFIKYIFDKIRDSFFVFSFGDRPINPVLWAHYANNTKGMVLSYDAEILHDLICENYLSCTLFEAYSNQIDFRNVKYLPNPNPIRINQVEQILSLINPDDLNIRDYSSNTKLIRFVMEELYDSLFFVKSPEWKCEDEIRLVLPASVIDKNRINQKHCTISKSPVTSILVTLNAPINELYTIFNITQKKKIKCFSLDQSSSTNELETTEIKEDFISLIIESPKTIG